ncbi:MAG TPA: TonB-dependent receptor [Terriglobales bacterium]|nr:TonB-dependent receptor [Terriglobales bacterium]
MRKTSALAIAFGIAFGIAIFIGCANSASAQGAAAAQLNGTVTDASGGSVAGAAISLRNTNTNTTSTATSNDRGFYFIANLTPGNYELKVSYTGFASYTQTGIVLTVGQAATINVGLQVESQGARVVVTTEAPTIEPTKTEISQIVNSQQIGSLPISGRLFTDFALLTPGVATSRTSLGTTFTEYEATQISFGGMRSFSNEITVDGADFVNSASGIQRSTPPQESVQEFRVVNNSFGAEYGRAIGGIVNIVTKGGTNDFHGSAYEYFQNQALDSLNLLQKKEPGLQQQNLPDRLQQNQFGGTVGGPISKDKTFFFINYEGKRRADSPLYPPDLVNNLQVIDDAKALMGLAPEGCTKAGLAACGFAPGSTISQAAAFGFLKGFLKTSNNDYGFARVDHQFNPSNRLSVRYNAEDARDSGELVGQTLDGGGIGVPSGGRDLFIRDQSLVGTLDTIVTPTLVNTVLVQYARRHYNFPGMTGQPDFSILNDLEVGHNFGTNDRLYESRVELGDSLSWVKGNHIWKFGFDGNYLWSLENFPGFTPTRMLVPTGGTNAAACLAVFADYYNGTVGSHISSLLFPADVKGAEQSCPVPQDNGVVFDYAGVPLPVTAGACQPFCTPTVTSTNNTLNTTTWANAYPQQFFNLYSRQIDHGYWGGFVQDQWRITPKLTINYGVRWDYESGLASYVNKDFNEWQPRVGLAWSPDGKTVVRAGFGIFFDRQNLTFFFVPNTQKIVAGYQCGNHLAEASALVQTFCGSEGVVPMEFPNIQSNLGQSVQGYQIFGFPASQGAAAKAASVIATGGYDAYTGSGLPTGTVALAGTCFSDGACGVGEGGMDHNSRTPYAEQASLEVDHQFGGGFALNATYLFVGAHKLVRGNNINIPCPVGTTKSGPVDAAAVPGLVNPNGTLSPCTGEPVLADSGPGTGSAALAGLGPWFGGVFNSGLQTLSGGLEDYNNDVANAAYHGGMLTAIERIKNFNLTANYTYSHTIDNGNFTTFINLPVNQFDYKAERANSNQDARHRLVTNFTATGPEDMWWTRHFTLSSIITLQSGRPFTMYYGNNTLNDVAGGATDRVGGPAVKSNCPSVSNCSTMISRNTYIGDPLYSWDFHLGRYFQLTERMKLDVSVDAFNLLNRSNVDEVTSVYGSPVFCGGTNGATPAIPRHYRDAVSRLIQAGSGGGITCPNGLAGETPVLAGPFQVGNTAVTPISNIFGTVSLFIPDSPNATFGLPRTMLNPRQFQFAAKFSF